VVYEFTELTAKQLPRVNRTLESKVSVTSEQDWLISDAGDRASSPGQERGCCEWVGPTFTAAVANPGCMVELLFEVVQESDGGCCGECLTEGIFTEADTWDDLRKNVIEATSAFFFDRSMADRIRLHLIRDEILSVA